MITLPGVAVYIILFLARRASKIPPNTLSIYITSNHL